MAGRTGVHWMYQRIVVHPLIRLSQPNEHGHSFKVNHQHWHTLKVFNMPTWMIMKWGWYINYWVARIQVRFPHHYVSVRASGYWPDGEADKAEIKKRKIASAQGYVTKVKNYMRKREYELSLTLFNNPDTDPVMIECREKLREKELKLQQIILEE